jgi:ADP-heptose:LPS heptosyltransferase
MVCLSAAIRDLHHNYPGRYLTDVRTDHPDLWLHNPHITPIANDDPDATVVQCMYDHAVKASNQRGLHLMEGYAEDLAEQLGLPHIRLTDFRGDIHLSDEERGWMSPPHAKYNVQRYWVICSGGKKDFTVKWPIPSVMQAVVDHFRGRLQFVQVGSIDDHWHHHPPLSGVLDLRGRTTLRELIRTVHSAQGVLSGISLPMHLAAAVPRPAWMPKDRPCVVVAGGREPRSWYGYKTHRILDTVGALECCRDGGCWHSRTVKLHDNQKSDERLCSRVVNDFPRCMWMIEPRDVIRAIEVYLEGEQPL